MKTNMIGRLAALALLLLAPASVWASCRVASGVIPQDIQMGVGQVIVPPDAAVGQVLKEREFPIRAIERVGDCNFWGGSIIGEMLQGSPSSLDSKIYTTNVEGVGVRLSRRLEANNTLVYYPHTFEYGSITLRLSEGFFRVEVIKIAPATGSGSLAAGRYTNYYMDGTGPGRPMLTSSLSANAITIVSSSCQVDAGSRNIAVDFGTTAAASFGGQGSTLNERSFGIQLRCSGPTMGQDQVDLSFAYTPDAGGAPGVIKVDEGSGAASGVGIQMLDRRNNQAIANGAQVAVGAVNAGERDKVLDLPLKARYYQTGPVVRPGQVRARATFTIEYR